tara:strand:+ start:1463 stop:1612 length:150 start_codon:yes stop_codon:yes gene_type:complete
MIEYFVAILLFSANVDNKTFVMPVPVTYPEERYVQEAYPVLEVKIENLN